jgi:predicted  nucleic acid-binding Zn-ribbon protein
MPYDRYAPADVAERIAAAENRLQKLRHRVNRLQQEGSDARDAQELLEFLSGNLGELDSRQSNMRRSSWVMGR